jgi:hypothetical protein
VPVTDVAISSERLAQRLTGRRGPIAALSPAKFVAVVAACMGLTALSIVQVVKSTRSSRGRPAATS